MEQVVLDSSKRLLQEEIRVLRNLYENLDYNSLVSAVALIKNAVKPIVVSGMGTSGILGRKIAASLSSIGCPSIFVHPGDAMHGNLGLIADQTVVILISHGGQTMELVKLLDASEDFSLKTVLITSNDNSILSKRSQISLITHVKNEGDPLGLVPTNSAIATLAIGDALMSGVAASIDASTEVFYRNHPSGSLGKTLSLRFRDIMQDRVKSASCVGVECTLGNAIVAMSAGRVGASFIVHDRRLVGLFTDGDLRRALAIDPKLDLDQKLINIAVQNFLTVQESDLVFPFIKNMENKNRRISVFPVLNQQKDFVGIVHLHDVLAMEL